MQNAECRMGIPAKLEDLTIWRRDEDGVAKPIRGREVRTSGNGPDGGASISLLARMMACRVFLPALRACAGGVLPDGPPDSASVSHAGNSTIGSNVCQGPAGGKCRMHPPPLGLPPSHGLRMTGRGTRWWTGADGGGRITWVTRCFMFGPSIGTKLAR
jgi:hypothetical protein